MAAEPIYRRPHRWPAFNDWFEGLSAELRLPGGEHMIPVEETEEEGLRAPSRRNCPASTPIKTSRSPSPVVY